jgi:Tol biopolymer transport system component
VISGLLVIAFGMNLLLQRRRDLALTGLTFAPHAHEHPHLPDSRQAPPHASPTLRSLLTLGISGGLVPCPDAIAILLVAVAVNRVPFGMLLIVSFSLGLALILIAIGVAMVHGVRWLGHNDWLSRFGNYAPLVSAVVVSGLGVGLTLSALNAFQLSALVSRAPGTSNVEAQAAPPKFDLHSARVLYIAADRAGLDQLFLLSLGTGKAVQYTNEASGIIGYSTSPDLKTILYSVYGTTGGSSIWAMNADGTQKRRVLDCPTAECNSPAWYPDGQKVAYERLEDSQDPSSVPRFSIWWLDLRSGKTQPVFQDAMYASTAPAFSQDGQWLSYIAAASNELMLYSLKDGSERSVPLGSQAAIPATWSPDGQALLFGNQASSGEPPPLHTKIYNIDSGQITDLGGPNNQTDFSAAWSPDGQWIAIDRNVPSADPSGSSNQVWLMKPDGTQTRVRLNEAHASYSDLKWSPDGRYLLYSRYMLLYSAQNPGHFNVYATDIQTGERTLVVPGGDLGTFIP